MWVLCEFGIYMFCDVGDSSHTERDDRGHVDADITNVVRLVHHVRGGRVPLAAPRAEEAAERLSAADLLGERGRNAPQEGNRIDTGGGRAIGWPEISGPTVGVEELGQWPQDLPYGWGDEIAVLFLLYVEENMLARPLGKGSCHASP